MSTTLPLFVPPSTCVSPCAADSPLPAVPLNVSMGWSLRGEEEVSLSASTASPHRSACASGASSPPLPGETLPTTIQAILSSAHVVQNVQEALSDLVFVLEESGERAPLPSQEDSSPSSSPFSSSPFSEGGVSAEHPLTSSSKIVPLVGSYSNADVIRGAIRRQQGERGRGLVSVSSSSGQVAFLVPMLLEAVAWRQP